MQISLLEYFLKRYLYFKCRYLFKNTLEGTLLENVESIKYLGVTIINDLRWNTHVSNICTRANRTLGFLRRNLYASPQEVKEAAYKELVHQVLGYSGSVWGPSGVGLQNE